VVARQNLRQGINMPLPNNNIFDIYVNEIVFSTSRISAKLFKTLTIEPENNGLKDPELVEEKLRKLKT
ncbi:11714_t:CDS:2, partial [Gigaspora margarita]